MTTPRDAEHQPPTSDQLMQLVEADRVSATQWGLVALELIDEGVVLDELATASGISMSVARGRLTRARKKRESDGASSPTATPPVMSRSEAGGSAIRFGDLVAKYIANQNKSTTNYIQSVVRTSMGAFPEDNFVPRWLKDLDPMGGVRTTLFDTASKNRVSLMGSGMKPFPAAGLAAAVKGPGMAAVQASKLWSGGTMASLAATNFSTVALGRQLAETIQEKYRTQLASMLEPVRAVSRRMEQQLLESQQVTNQAMMTYARTTPLATAMRNVFPMRTQFAATMSQYLQQFDTSTTVRGAIGPWGASVPAFDVSARNLLTRLNIPTLANPYEVVPDRVDAAALDALQLSVPEVAAAARAEAEQSGVPWWAKKTTAELLAYAVCAAVTMLYTVAPILVPDPILQHTPDVILFLTGASARNVYDYVLRKLTQQEED